KGGEHDGGGQSHRQHPVREHTGKTDGLRDVITVVDGVEIARGARVADERLAREVDGALGDDVSDGESHASPSSAPTSSTLVAVTTCSPAASVITASLVTIELPAIMRMPVTFNCPVSSSPATIGFEYVNFCSAWMVRASTMPESGSASSSCS